MNRLAFTWSACHSVETKTLLKFTILPPQIPFLPAVKSEA